MGNVNVNLNPDLDGLLAKGVANGDITRKRIADLFGPEPVAIDQSKLAQPDVKQQQQPVVKTLRVDPVERGIERAARIANDPTLPAPMERIRGAIDLDPLSEKPDVNVGGYSGRGGRVSDIFEGTREPEPKPKGKRVRTNLLGQLNVDKLLGSDVEEAEGEEEAETVANDPVVAPAPEGEPAAAPVVAAPKAKTKKQAVAAAPTAPVESKTDAPKAYRAEKPANQFEQVLDKLKKGRVASFTGHRPANLQDPEAAYARTGVEYDRIVASLEANIRRAYANGYRTFITGMALGVDTWAAEKLLELKATEMPDIVIISAIPFVGQERVWEKNPENIATYKDILSKIDGAGLVTNRRPKVIGKRNGKEITDAAELLEKRNKAMLDNSDLLIAVFNKEGIYTNAAGQKHTKGKGGTKSAVARAYNRNYTILWYNNLTNQNTVVIDGKVVKGNKSPVSDGAEVTTQSDTDEDGIEIAEEDSDTEGEATGEVVAEDGGSLFEARNYDEDGDRLAGEATDGDEAIFDALIDMGIDPYTAPQEVVAEATEKIKAAVAASVSTDVADEITRDGLPPVEEQPINDPEAMRDAIGMTPSEEDGEWGEEGQAEYNFMAELAQGYSVSELRAALADAILPANSFKEDYLARQMAQAIRDEMAMRGVSETKGYQPRLKKNLAQRVTIEHEIDLNDGPIAGSPEAIAQMQAEGDMAEPTGNEPTGVFVGSKRSDEDWSNYQSGEEIADAVETTVAKLRPEWTEYKARRGASEAERELRDAIRELAHKLKNDLEKTPTTDLYRYITMKGRQAPHLAQWGRKAKNLLDMLANKETPFASMNVEEVNWVIGELWNMIEEDSLQEAIAKNEVEYRKEHGTEESDVPQPRRWEAVVALMKNIQRNLQQDYFILKGDTVKKVKGQLEVTHSEAVTTAIRDFLIAIGYKDVSKHERLEKYLFQAFQYYRGASIDQNEKWMGEDKDDPTISDEAFIKALNEMHSNILTKNYAFAYMFPNAKLGGTLCFPMPMPPDIAEFFTANKESNPEGLSINEYVDYGINQHNKIIERFMASEANLDQRLVLLGFVGAITDMHPDMGGANVSVRGDSRPVLHARKAEDLMTLMEMYDITSEWAKLHNDENDLKTSANNRNQKLLYSISRTSAYREKYADSQAMQNRFRKLNSIAITNQLLGKANFMLGVTGVLEKFDGMNRMDATVRILARLAKGRLGIDVAPSKTFLAEFGKSKGIGQFIDALKIAGTTNHMYALNVAAHDESVIFGQNAFETTISRGLDDTEAERVVKAAGGYLEKTSHAAIAISTGDVFGNKRMAQIFLRYYCLYMAEADKYGDVAATPEMLEQMYKNDPDRFFKQAMASAQGQQALKAAAQTSIAGYNMISATIGRWIDSPRKQFFFGFLVTFFAKYQANILLKHIPLSTALMYLIKHNVNLGVTASAASKAEKGDGVAIEQGEAWIQTTNALTIGGDKLSVRGADGTGVDKEAFNKGLQECLIVDTVSGLSDASIFFIMMLVVAALGIEPPDEDEEDKGKIYRWDEWKIGGKVFGEGETIKLGWFWGDFLKFSMPTIVAIEAAKKSGNDVGWKVFTHGAWDAMESNSWVSMMGILDLVQSATTGYEEASLRNEDADIQKDDYFLGEVSGFLIRRALAVVEPAYARELYNEGGLFGGARHLDVSSTKIFTPDPEDDETATTMTTYADAVLRRNVKNSPGAGFLLNVLTGYYGGDESYDKTGFMRGDRPLVANVDPVNQMWVDRLTPRTEDGTVIEFEPTNPEQFAAYQAITTEVKALIENPEYSPQVLAASGIVLPYNARVAVSFAYDLEAELIRREFNTRKANGEFYVKGGFDYDKIVAAGQSKLESETKRDARLKELKALKEKLWSDAIPYSAIKMNRYITNFDTYAVWKEGTEKAGQPADPWLAMFMPTKVEIRLYPRGDHKSSWLPWTKVDDAGDPSYDARPASAWQNDFTNRELLEGSIKGYIVPNGIGAGEELLALSTADGATGLNPTKKGDWKNEYLYPLRGYLPESKTPKEQAVPEFDWDAILGAEENTEETDDSGGGGGGGGWGGSGGGGSYSPTIYSHPAYSINADRPAQLYSKTPNYTRFDYLRPSVKTKGSREAYRREDF